MTKDIHSKPFDEGTTVKLELFKLYLRSWLPVFVERSDNKIEIYDYFAGEGSDVDGNWGSPLIILDEIKPYCAKLLMNHIELQIQFNDFAKKKVSILESKSIEKLKICSDQKKYGFCKQNENNTNCPFIIKYLNEDFGNLFAKDYVQFSKSQNVPRFILLDQYGIKQINTTVFNRLTELKQTDFMFFISSSFIKRFKEQPEFQAYIDSEKLDFSENRPSECHRVVFNYYKALLNNKNYFLGQFSIKKNSNIYGVIFGSNHPLGLRKFLDAAWKIDPHTGETNHDIDDDSIRQGQTSFDFFGTGIQDKVKKLVAFENELLIFLTKEQTNRNVYIFALEKGISISKSLEILKSLEKKDRLSFSGDKRQKGAYYLDYDHEKHILIKIK